METGMYSTKTKALSSNRHLTSSSSNDDDDSDDDASRKQDITFKQIHLGTNQIISSNDMSPKTKGLFSAHANLKLKPRSFHSEKDCGRDEKGHNVAQNGCERIERVKEHDKLVSGQGFNVGGSCSESSQGMFIDGDMNVGKTFSEEPDDVGGCFIDDEVVKMGSSSVHNGFNHLNHFRREFEATKGDNIVNESNLCNKDEPKFAETLPVSPCGFVGSLVSEAHPSSIARSMYGEGNRAGSVLENRQQDFTLQLDPTSGFINEDDDAGNDDNNDDVRNRKPTRSDNSSVNPTPESDKMQEHNQTDTREKSNTYSKVEMSKPDSRGMNSVDVRTCFMEDAKNVPEDTESATVVLYDDEDVILLPVGSEGTEAEPDDNEGPEAGQDSAGGVVTQPHDIEDAMSRPDDSDVTVAGSDDSVGPEAGPDGTEDPLAGPGDTEDALSRPDDSEDTVDRSDDTGHQPVLEKAPVKAEPPVIAASFTNSLSKNMAHNWTSSDSQLNQTSPNAIKQIQTIIGATKSLPVSEQNKALLNFLQQNGIPLTEPGSQSASENPCKVVTKYVYIDKHSKLKAHKRNFGFLYRQAFRHSYSGKVRERNGKAKFKQTLARIHMKRQQEVGKIKMRHRFSLETSSHRKINTVDADRVTRQIVQESKNCTSLDKEDRRMKEKMEKKKRKRAESEDDGKESKKVKRKKNLKDKKEKKKLGKLDQTDKSKVVKSVGKSLISKSVFEKKKNETSNKSQKTNIEARVRDEREGKTKKKHKTNEEETKVEVKQEAMDELGEFNYPLFGSMGADLPIHQTKLKIRNRKDLTLQEKLQAINALETPGSKFVAVAKRFGVSVSAISRINKNKEYILMQSLSGDLNITQKRARECKDPELDKVLLRWYRAAEATHSHSSPFAISNFLLKEKAHELAFTMGKDYFPSDNWIIRWKTRHNIRSTVNSSGSGVIQDREEFKELDSKVNICEILEEMGKHEFKIDQVKQEIMMRRREKPEELFVCEHCGVLTSSKKRKENNHLPGCPASSVRKDLTLSEKVQVVRALEQPGVKMVTLAKKYGVSASAISRINKNRVDILARRASGLANCERKRDRGSKEPEVEKALCEWFKVQHDMGIHISGSMIREKAREIAKVMGKDFWPSESWVFRWRHRNNVADVNAFLYPDSDEGELGGLERNNDNAEDLMVTNVSEDVQADKIENNVDDSKNDATDEVQKKSKKKKGANLDSSATKQFRLPRSVMCEKCGFVSCRVKNNRIKSLRHAKGCPDLKPRNELTYECRAQMLKALDEPGATLSSVARQFGVSVSSMSRMNQKKDQIFSHCEDHAGQKRIRDCKEPEVAHILYRWYLEKKTEGIHVTGPKLKEKAKKIAAEMGREFNASSGWLGRWRQRYNIVCSVRGSGKIQDPSRRRKLKQRRENKQSSSEQMLQMQMIPHDIHQDSLGSGSSIVESMDPAPSSQATSVFLHQRFQNPWDITQQQANACVWTKEFLASAGPGALDEPAVSVAYTYGDAVSKPVFHSMFDSFAAVGYQVTMPAESSSSGRDYLKPDNNNENKSSSSSSGSHLPHSSHLSHNPLQHHLHTQQLLQHHIPVAHPHSLTQQQQQVGAHPHTAHPLPAPSPLDEDTDQQRQLMEAIKMMSSFAQKRSLGDEVQAALKTIEMSMRGPTRKSSSRNTYTSI